MAKKRKKQTAKKRKKHNLAGLDFQELMDLRDQVDKALSGYRSTLGGTWKLSRIAWWEGCPRDASEQVEGNEGCAEISWFRRRTMGWTWRNAKVVGCGNQRRQKAGRFFNR
jgi:hypothetical protein